MVCQFKVSSAQLSPSVFTFGSSSNVHYIAGGISMGLSLYNKLRLTGGLNLTDADKLVVDDKLEKRISEFEKDSRVNYERFR